MTIVHQAVKWQACNRCGSVNATRSEWLRVFVRGGKVGGQTGFVGIDLCAQCADKTPASELLSLRPANAEQAMQQKGSILAAVAGN